MNLFIQPARLGRLSKLLSCSVSFHLLSAYLEWPGTVRIEHHNFIVTQKKDACYVNQLANQSCWWSITNYLLLHAPIRLLTSASCSALPTDSPDASRWGRYLSILGAQSIMGLYLCRSDAEITIFSKSDAFTFGKFKLTFQGMQPLGPWNVCYGPESYVHSALINKPKRLRVTDVVAKSVP